MAKTKPVTIQQMVSALELDDITFYELSGKLHDSPDDPRPEASENERAEPTEATWGFRTRHEGVEFGVRLRNETITSSGKIVVDISAEYKSAKPIRIPRDVAYEFVNNVTLMQLIPFIREALMTTSVRVFGHGVMMPIFQRGEIKFDSPGSGPDISEG